MAAPQAAEVQAVDGVLRAIARPMAAPQAAEVQAVDGVLVDMPDDGKDEDREHLAQMGANVEKKDFRDLIRLAKRHMAMTACTIHDQANDTYRWRPLFRTTVRDLGVYGVGVTLYFHFVLQMGLVFLLCAFFAIPNVYFNRVGNMVDSGNVLSNFLGKLSIANIGACQGGYCETDADVADRCLLNVFPCETKLRDVTQWLGLADAIGILAVMLWSVLFHRWWMPRMVAINGAANLTAADFSIEIPLLPRSLQEGHEQYEAKMREHFLDVLKRMKEPVDDPNAIVDVALVREYDGAVSKFMQKGDILMDQQTHMFISQSFGAKGDAKSQKRADKEHKAAMKKYDRQKKLEISLRKQAEMRDTDREVVRAFVTFRTEALRNAVLSEYRFSPYIFFRCCQPQKLRFCGSKIKVVAACEPSDLYWENLDFSWCQRQIRKAIVVLLTFLILVVCSVLLVFCQSATASATDSVNSNLVWIIKSTPHSNSGCLQLCGLELFSDVNCGSNGDTSNNWPIARVFDASRDYPPTNGKYDWGASCANNWTSPACGTPSNGNCAEVSQDWLGIQFSSQQAANCMKVQLAASRLAEEVQLFGCSTAPPAAGQLSCWAVEDSCEPMVVNKLKPPAAVSTASWLSGRQTVVPDSSCAMTITTELAYQKWSSFSKGSLERVTNPVLNCYCRQNPELRIPPYDTKEKEICQDWSYEENFKVGRIVGGTFAVIILNQLILMVYEVLVAWERHCTVTEVAQSQLLKLFLSQFVNTGMLVLLVNAELKEIPAWFVPFRVLQIGTGKYDDFNGEWYVAIGSGICLTIFIQVFSTTVPPLVKSFCVQPILARFFGRSQVIQDRMDKIYTLPDWNISLRLAQTLNVMFVITMYSSGLPILYFVGFVYCIVAFWMDKWCLLHGSSKPPAFNQSIIKTTLHLFPLAAFLHTIVACWTFGNQRLFPSPWSRLLPLAEMIFGMDEQTYNETIEAYLNANEEVKSLTQGKYFRARTVDFARDGCWLLLLIFLVFCAYYLIYWVLKIFLKPFVAPFMFAVKDCCCKKNKHAGDTTLEWKDCVRKSQELHIIHSYRIEANVKYRAAYLALADTEKQVVKKRTSKPTE